MEKLSTDARNLAEANGWNAETLLRMVAEYIAENRLQLSLEVFLAERATVQA